MTTHAQFFSTNSLRSDDAAPASHRPLIDLTSDELEMLASLADHKAPPSPSEPTYWPGSAWF
jgi:hypothetical protein